MIPFQLVSLQLSDKIDFTVLHFGCFSKIENEVCGQDLREICQNGFQCDLGHN